MKLQYRFLILARLLFFLLCSSLVFADALSKNVLKWQITGIKGALKENVRLYLKTLPDIKIVNLHQSTPFIKGKIIKALSALGYYHPNIIIHRPITNKTILISIKKGRPILINKINVILEESNSDPEFLKLIKQLPLIKGAVLNQGKYEDFKDQINNILVTHGYVEGSITQSHITIDKKKYSADISIMIHAKQRYHFGVIIFHDAVPLAVRTIIEHMRPFYKGEPYDEALQGRLFKQLSETGYFKKIQIKPIKKINQQYMIPIKINVELDQKEHFAVGAGFSTDNGYRFSALWNKVWLNNRGDSLSNELLLSKNKSLITSNYNIPIHNPVQNYYNFKLVFGQQSIADINSHTISATINRWYKKPFLDNGSRNINPFFRIMYEDYTQTNKTGQSVLLLPGVGWDRIFTQDKSRINNGNRMQFNMQISNKAWASNKNFIRLWAKNTWLHTFFKKHAIILRFEQGAILSRENVDELPPTLRFFAGGSQSVRGFAYESISPTNQDNQLIGGRYLTTASIEYNYALTPKWTLALFTDTGTATNNYKDKWAIGSGFGVYWVTLLGKIGGNLAFAVSEKKAPWRINISIGTRL